MGATNRKLTWDVIVDRVDDLNDVPKTPPSMVKKLHERIAELEGHRDQWRRRAFHLEDLIREKNFEAAAADVAESDEEARNAYRSAPSNSDAKEG